MPGPVYMGTAMRCFLAPGVSISFQITFKIFVKILTINILDPFDPFYPFDPFDLDAWACLYGYSYVRCFLAPGVSISFQKILTFKIFVKILTSLIFSIRSIRSIRSIPSILMPWACLYGYSYVRCFLAPGVSISF